MPSVVIDLDIIADNTRRVMDSLGANVRVFGVTKAACGSPLVARAMLRGGAAGLADSRLDNVQRLRNSGITAPVGLPGEQTNTSWVRAQTSAGTLSQSTAKLRAATLGT